MLTTAAGLRDDLQAPELRRRDDGNGGAMFASRRDDGNAPKPHQRRRGAAFCSLMLPFTRAAARIYASTRKHAQAQHARNAQARNARRATHTHKHALTAQARRKHVARTDKAQHVTKPPQRGQIRVLWSKSINDATAALPLKIGALQAAKRQAGQRAHAIRAKGRGKA